MSTMSLMPDCVQGRDEGVEVVEAAQLGRDGAVVVDVVAAVGERRGVERAQPDGVDAEPPQVVDAPDDAAQVADPVTVRVGEAARVDLVDDGLAPPGRVGGNGRASRPVRSRGSRYRPAYSAREVPRARGAPGLRPRRGRRARRRARARFAVGGPGPGPVCRGRRRRAAAARPHRRAHRGVPRPRPQRRLPRSGRRGDDVGHRGRQPAAGRDGGVPQRAPARGRGRRPAGRDARQRRQPDDPPGRPLRPLRRGGRPADGRRRPRTSTPPLPSRAAGRARPTSTCSSRNPSCPTSLADSLRQLLST